MVDDLYTLMRHEQLRDFVEESNRIEGIGRKATSEELEAHSVLLNLPKLRVSDICNFVSVIQPGAVLRDKAGLNVYVGNHRPPPGSPAIFHELAYILELANKKENSWDVHCQYETLHAFTDCNGRSGRAIWAWMRPNLDLGFLHQFYYDTLENYR